MCAQASARAHVLWLDFDLARGLVRRPILDCHAHLCRGRDRLDHPKGIIGDARPAIAARSLLAILAMLAALLPAMSESLVEVLMVKNSFDPTGSNCTCTGVLSLQNQELTGTIPAGLGGCAFIQLYVLSSRAAASRVNAEVLCAYCADKHNTDHNTDPGVPGI